MATRGDLTVALKLQADVAEAVKALDAVDQGLTEVEGHDAGSAAGGLDRVSRSAITAAKATRSVGASGKDAAEGLGAATEAASKADNAVSEFSGRISGIATAVAGAFGLAALAGKFLSISDEMSSMTARLALVTQTSRELSDVQQRLFENSQSSQTAFKANTELYVSMAQATDGLGLNQQRLIALTDGISKAFVVAGTDAQTTSGVIRQFAQALQSGVLRGDEFVSMMEGSPRLMRAMAEGLGTTIGKLKAMADAGELTTDRILPALENGLAGVRAEYDQMPPTVSRATQAIENALDQWVAKTDKTLGSIIGSSDGASHTISQDLAKALTSIANNLDLVANTATVAGAAIVGRYVGSLTVSTAASIRDIAAKNRALAAEVAYQQGLARTAVLQGNAALGANALAAARTAEAAATARATAAQAAMISTAGIARGALSLLGGPIGLVTTALTVGVTAWALWGQKADDATRAAEQAATERLDAVIKKIVQLNGTLGAATKAQYQATVTSAEDALRNLKPQVEYLNNRLDALDSAGGRGRFSAEGEKLQAELNGLEQREIALQQQLADARQHAADVGIDGIKAFTDANLSGVAKVEDQVAKLREGYDKAMQAAGGFSASNPVHVKALETLNARIAELRKGSKTATTDPVGNAYASQLQTLTTQLASARQRLANAQAGVTGSQDLATTRLEAWLATNRQALKLDDARVSKLRELAKEIDKAGAATSEQEALNAAAKRAAEGLRGIEDDWLAATGQAADASAAKIEERYRKLREDLQTTGDTAGLAKLDVVVSTEKSRAALVQLQAEIEQVFSAQQRDEQSIDAQVSAGLITQIEGQTRLVDLHAQTAQQIERYLPQLRALATLPGAVGDQARAQLQTLETQLVKLRTTTDELQNALRNGVQSGLESAVKGLADGTLNLAGAIRTLLSSVAEAMLQISVKNLSQYATDGLTKMLGGATAGTTEATAIGTAGATTAATMGTSITAAGTASATAMAAGISGASTTGAAAMSAGIVSAGTTAAAAMATAITTASSGSAASSAGAAAIAAGFAEGGYTGPGGVYQIAGIVHAGEFVTRQAVTHQPGAIEFLTDFNARGMAALEGWRGYATGGLVTAPSYAPSRILPASIVQSPGGGGSTTVRNAQTFLLVDSPERIASAMQSAAGQEAVTVMLSRDPAKFRSILGIT